MIILGVTYPYIRRVVFSHVGGTVSVVVGKEAQRLYERFSELDNYGNSKVPSHAMLFVQNQHGNQEVINMSNIIKVHFSEKDL